MNKTKKVKETKNTFVNLKNMPINYEPIRKERLWLLYKKDDIEESYEISIYLCKQDFIQISFIDKILENSELLKFKVESIIPSISIEILDPLGICIGEWEYINNYVNKISYDIEENFKITIKPEKKLFKF